MRLNRETWRLHRFWAFLFGIGLLISIGSGIDFQNYRLAFPGGSSTVGYLLGVIAGLIIIFEVLLWPRKKLLRRWRLGRVRTWMAAHLWLGVLTVPMAIVHAGVPWGGSLASATIILLFVVVASGIFGLIMQQWIPRQMTHLAPQETIYSQIDRVIEESVVEADALVSATCGQLVGETDWSTLYPADKAGTEKVSAYVGASRSIANIYGTAVVAELPPTPIPNSQILQGSYENTVRHYLIHGQSKSNVLGDESRQDSYFRELASKLEPEAAPVIQQLQDWCNQRRQLRIQRTLHHWLHIWLAIHLPLSLALLVLLLVHAWVATKYSGIFSFL